jgi:hypothetical protein
MGSIMQEMPMGHFVRRKSENQFRRETPRRYEWMAIEWLEWEAKNTGYHVSYQGNQNRKCLIESMYGEKIIVISPLLKWYVQHGLLILFTVYLIFWLFTNSAKNSTSIFVQIAVESFRNLLEHVSILGHQCPVRLLADFCQVAQTGPHCLSGLEDEGIDVPAEDRYYPYRAIYDIEVMLQPTDKRRSEKLEWTSHHVLLSVSSPASVSCKS